MRILGFADNHDSSAAVVANGRVVAACGQERIDRVKNSGAFPWGAIDAVLDQAGGGGEHHVGSDRGHDDEVYIRGVHIPLAQEALADCCGHERGGQAVQYPTLPDAGALPDPGVGGVDYLL